MLVSPQITQEHTKFKRAINQLVSSP